MVKLTDSQLIVQSSKGRWCGGCSAEDEQSRGGEDRIESHWPEADAGDQIQARHAGLA